MKKFIVILLVVLLVLGNGSAMLAESTAAPETKPVDPLMTAGEVGDVLFGFKMLRKEAVPDIGATAVIYEHEKTGAELIWLANADPFKVFSACFKTEPADNYGAAHIVEHALLGGSRKYKSNDIFTDMSAISTNAFMNAMTYPDKTVFPVSSRDPQDFFNLTDVYLDSVFFPVIKEEKRIFDQEGWHYEIFAKDEPITYNGVVYNEMRGAMSDPIRTLVAEAAKTILPDTTYAKNSGGSPDEIPDLTYEGFLEFYQKFYNPTNVLLYFYGDVNIGQYLEHIDAEYLSKFAKTETKIEFEKQSPFTERQESEAFYNIPDDEEEEGRDYLSYNIYAGEGGNIDNYFMLNILADVLLDSNAAPIKNALFDKGIGEDNGSLCFQYNQETFGVVAINATAEQKDEFIATVDEELQRAVTEGLDKDALKAAINKLELSLRAADGNDGLKGLDYLDLLLDSRNYGGDPLAYFNYSAAIAKLRAGVDEGAYEQYISERLLNNPFSSVLVMKPQKGLSDKKAAEVEEKLAAYKASLSEADLEALIKENEVNRARKEAGSEENTLPKLKLADIDKNLNQIDYKVSEVDGTTILHAPEATSDIVYLNFQFDLSTVDEELLPYANFLSKVLGNLDTEKYDYGSLEKEMYIYTGGIGYSCFNAEHTKTHEQNARFVMSGEATGENLGKLFELMDEICFRTSFADKVRIKQILTSMKNSTEKACASSGQGVALLRSRSYYSPMFQYREKLSGFEYLRFLQDFEANFDEKGDEYLAKLAEVYKTVFNRKNLLLGVCCDDKDYAQLEADLGAFLAAYPNEELPNLKFNLPVEALNEGIIANTQVNYVVKTGDLKQVMDKVDGSARLLSNILNNLYLYPELRAKGGAYGAYSIVDNYGNLCVYTYRDPNVKETVDVFDKMGAFVREIDLAQEDLEQLIIGYFKAAPRTPDATASEICYRYSCGLSNEDFFAEADEVVATDLAKIRSYGDVIDKIMEGNFLCVVGNDKSIKDNETLFKNVLSVVPATKTAE